MTETTNSKNQPAVMNCILAGVGGQGTVLASKLIAQSAMNRGLFARTAETIGMAQRGGCVVSHVRIGRNPQDVPSPLLPPGSADLVLGFEPSEAVRCLPYRKPGGAVVVCSKAVQPVTASLSGKSYDAGAMIAHLQKTVERLVVLDGDALLAQCPSPKTLNVALLGAAVQALQAWQGPAAVLTLTDVENTILQRLPQKYHEMNQSALRAGARLAIQANPLLAGEKE